jgi:tRNA dimethylallyltransferase
MANPSSRPQIVAVVGATAAGKTGLSLDLAERLDGEIVNTDAMAVYRGMDIGTATPPSSERRGIPHHLLDLLDVTEPLTVAEFQGWARDAIAEVRGRRRTPILVGGSALYTRAVVDRFEFPGTDPAVRRELEAELAAVGPAEMHRRLARQDPESAAQILPENGRRIVRALEVVAITGAGFRASLPEPEYVDPDTVQIGVDIDRATLDARIEQRVRQMFDDGLVDEVRRLLAVGLAEGRTARSAIGYREVASYLAGELTLAQAIEGTAAATRRFSRRQDGWFRKDSRVVWVPWDASDRVERAMAAVARVT